MSERNTPRCVLKFCAFALIVSLLVACAKKEKPASTSPAPAPETTAKTTPEVKVSPLPNQAGDTAPPPAEPSSQPLPTVEEQPVAGQAETDQPSQALGLRPVQEQPEANLGNIIEAPMPPPMAPPPPKGGGEHFPTPHWANISVDELRSDYDNLFAMSDIHGSLDLLTPLLKRAGIITFASTDQRYVWAGTKTRGQRNLFIVVGDSINKGEGSADVLLRLKELQDQAETKGGKVIVLLGNHEGEFLADPSDCSEEFIKSAKKIPGIQKGGKLSCKDIDQSKLGDFMRTFPVGAVVGSWLFAHSGYLGCDEQRKWKITSQKQKVLFQFLKDTTQARAKKDYKTLVDEDNSILKTHDWWKKGLGDIKDALQILGLTGLIVGHEPSFMDADGTMAMNAGGWIMKLDAGMNPEKEESKGRVLKCQVSRIAPARAPTLTMSTVGRPVCTQIAPKSEKQLEVIKKL